MKTVRLLTGLAFLIPCSHGLAQDLVIANARIIDGAGQTIEEGSIVVTEGRISSISAAAVDAGDAVVIDARGMTVLPGLIDVHRHDLLGSLQAFAELASDAEVAEAAQRGAPERMQALLDEGFTTVMMPGMFLSAGADVRQRLERGEMAGPRLLLAGPAFTAPDDFPARGMVCGDNAYCSERVAYQVTDPAVARAHVRSLAEAGVDVIKVFLDDEGTDLGDEVFAAIADEADAHGLPTYLHAHRVEDMLDGVRLGADRLVHTPSDTLIANGPGARILRERGVAIATTASYTAPAFAEAMGFPYSAEARHERLLQNVRHLVDEGVVVAFGTDSPDGIRPMVEIEELSRVLEPEEVIATLTRNAALFLELEDEIGTIEPGKVADLVIVNGNPMADIHDLARVQVVIQEGVVVVDNRSSAASAQDAAAVDSAHYRVEFENDAVRALRVTYGPGERSVMHEHPEGMLVFLTDGEGTFTFPDGTTQTFRWKAGQVEWVPAMAHLPENIGEKAYELLFIEMKRPAEAPVRRP